MNNDILHIVEISPHVHAGNIMKGKTLDGPLITLPNGKDTIQSIPCGGVSFLFNRIFEYAFKYKVIFVGDRNADYKKSINHDYKSNRKNDFKIKTQMRLAELILKDCGFTVLTEEGYEADDIVYSLVEKYHKKFKRIVVHTGDSDLFICVKDNVEISPASSRQKYVNKENYETAVKRDEIVPYNTLTFKKFLYGETTDSYGSLPKELASRIYNTLYQPQYYESLGNRAWLRGFISQLFPEALPNFDVAYPLEIPVSIDDWVEPDLMRAKVWGSLLQNRNFGQIQSTPPSIQALLDQIFRPGSEFLDD